MIENVGNLVCPAEFRVGEDARVMVCSVTEGEDKPLKYPLMFRTCELVLVNKIDLLPHLDFDLDKLLYNLDAVHPDVERMLVSARTGEGIDAWRDWLARVRGSARGARLNHAVGADPSLRRVDAALPSAPTPTGLLRARGRAPGARCATAWPSASRAAGGWWRSGCRPPRARTCATWRSSSYTR